MLNIIQKEAYKVSRIAGMKQFHLILWNLNWTFELNFILSIKNVLMSIWQIFGITKRKWKENFRLVLKTNFSFIKNIKQIHDWHLVLLRKHFISLLLSLSKIPTIFCWKLISWYVFALTSFFMVNLFFFFLTGWI